LKLEALLHGVDDHVIRTGFAVQQAELQTRIRGKGLGSVLDRAVDLGVAFVSQMLGHAQQSEQAEAGKLGLRAAQVAQQVRQDARCT
jgi:hypothetical protein